MGLFKPKPKPAPKTSKPKPASNSWPHRNGVPASVRITDAK